MSVLHARVNRNNALLSLMVGSFSVHPGSRDAESPSTIRHPVSSFRAGVFALRAIRLEGVWRQEWIVRVAIATTPSLALRLVSSSNDRTKPGRSNPTIPHLGSKKRDPRMGRVKKPRCGIALHDSTSCLIALGRANALSAPYALRACGERNGFRGRYRDHAIPGASSSLIARHAHPCALRVRRSAK